MTTNKQIDWAPRLQDNGRVFCSSACGFGCTKDNHDAAQRHGAALAARMGEGWKARVWENCTWHYAANHETAPLAIHPTIRRWEGRTEHEEGVDEYTVYLNVNPQIITKCADPGLALHQAIEELDEHISRLQANRYAIMRPIQDRWEAATSITNTPPAP